MSGNQITLAVQCWRNLLLWCGASFGVIALVWLVLRQPTLGALLAVGVIALLFGIALFFGRDGVLSHRRALPALLIAAILFPCIRLPGGIPDVRPEFIIVIAALGLLFLGHLATGRPIRLRCCPAYKWFGLFGFSIVLSMVYAAWLKGQPIIGRDFWELAKVFLYFLIFALAASQNISPTNLKRYYKLALLALVLSAFFSFLQYIDFPGINEVVSPYYAPTQMRGLLVHGRVTGTTPNPNEFGALMVLAASLALSGALFLQEWKLRLLCWGTLPVFGLALILTLSRSALVALLLAGATVLFLFLRQKGLKRKFRRLLTFVLLGCVIVALILQVMPEKAFFRFGQLATFTEATSWQGRVANWETHFAIWLESPWLGWGPGKADMGTIVDNEWLLLLRRYGVVGLAVFLCLFGSLFFGLSRIRNVTSEPSVVALSVALQGTLVGYALYMMLAAIYHSLQLMPILLLFLGLAYSQWRLRRATVQEVLMK